ncbi:aspartate kinase [Paenibacillus sp. ACRRY]|uniref:aspartate kinase n=1 Tax=Paenibacillus sp. ACRRY TaxID=2918208 RepID=UPI001EF51B57|nr:aspartate kinase [Paenibacillus sp. ACRRY]MCG7382504.1 aspartate kinase [Paenibacillus sp. ACRRY]
MRIMVQKFGGTSLSTVQAREHVLRHIKRELEAGLSLVIVVSAMGRRGEPYATDTLLDWAAQNGNALSAREKDLLLCCGEIISATTLSSLLEHENIPTTVLTGAQAGFVTDDNFGNARILDVRPVRVLEELQKDRVVIVTGFQGQTESGDFTTLGRGGSDTSATALGAALHAEMVDIYTDVNGILTADPRIVEDARPLTVVSYAEICNMAHHGAKVIHPRAVEIAMQSQIPVRVRSTFADSEGTLVTHPEGFQDVQTGIVDRYVTGIAYVSNVTQITVDVPGGADRLQLKVFKTMAENSISVDFINVTPSGVVYTVFDSDSEKAIQVLQEIGLKPQSLSGCAKVSVIGGGINGVPGIMARIVESLTLADIQILQSADSNTTIWVLVKKEDMVQALRALHTSFELHL